MDKKEKKTLVRLNKVVGYLYLPSRPIGSAIIFAKGGPSLGEDGKSPIFDVAKKYNQILFVPDYIGQSRSDGKFNFQNCIKTLYEVEDFLKGKIDGVDTFTGEKIQLNCDDIILVGSSWGGAIVPFINKYRQTSIKEVGLISPVTNWLTQGKTKYKEEDVTQTDLFIKSAWKNIYRGYKDSEWPKIFAGKAKEFNPIDNTELLKGLTVHISHGKQDKTINWRKSHKYYQQLIKDNVVDKAYIYFLDGNHGSNFNALALEKIMKEKGGGNNEC